MSEREMLAKLSYAVGSYIECDERPRPTALWTAMAEAQMEAAIYLNDTTIVDPLGDDAHKAAMHDAGAVIAASFAAQPTESDDE